MDMDTNSARAQARLVFWRAAAALVGRAADHPDVVVRLAEYAPFLFAGALALSLGRVIGHLLLWLWA
jgi:hypothetical protein